MTIVRALWKKRRVVGCVTVALICFAVFCPAALAATPEYSTTVDTSGNTVAMPVSYTAEKFCMYFGENVGALSDPQDIFYRDGLLYVADTGNNRVIVLDRDLQALRVIDSSSDPFNSPNGVFADADGDVFVADTNNGRIVHLAPDGEMVETFGQPHSKLYDVDYTFKPLKVYIDTIGQFYIINKEDYHGFITMDALGEFKGYVAPTKVGDDLWRKLVELVATEEQLAQLDKTLPPVHTNFVMDGTGAIYVTTGRTETMQLKKFMSVGENVFPYTGSFGSGEEGDIIVDVSVSQEGIVTLLEGTTGKIYQYDQDGVLLTIFGGAGNWSGVFMSASSLCEDEEGNLYVLDAGTGAITVWRPTGFIKQVHEALNLLHSGKYEESMQVWEKVLKVDQNFAVARIGMGKAYLRREEYSLALEQFTIADYKSGYSEAFAGLRHETFRKYFGLWVLGAVALLFGVYFGVRALRRFAARLVADEAHRKGAKN